MNALLLLAGLYLQDCGTGFQRAEEFQGDSVVYSETNFFDRACIRPALVVRSYGPFVLGSEVPEPPGARELDFTFRKVTVSLADEGVAADYSARSVCGISRWNAGEETEVTGRSCGFFPGVGPLRIPSAGERRFGIVRVGEKEIHLGRLSPGRDSTSPAARPRELDPSPYRLLGEAFPSSERSTSR